MPYFIKCFYKDEDMKIKSDVLDLSSTVNDLLVKIYARWFNGVERDLILVSNGELENKTKTFKDYDFAETRNIIKIALGNQGGGKFPSNVKTTKTTCVFYYMEYDCAKLECGCYMSHVGVVEFIKSCNDHLELLKCPQCKKILQKVGKLLYLANYDDDDEYEKIYEQFTERYRKHSKEEGSQSLTACPTCKCLNKRPKSLRQYRIKCGGCKRDYCFECEGKWKRSNFVLCGNEDCDTWDTQYQLQNCKPLLATNGRSWVTKYNDKWAKTEEEKLPSLRVCPSCWRLLTVVAECQHITCEGTGCGHEFCYVCLKNWKSHNSTTCFDTKPPPRQTLS